ncbi:MAG: 4Fe-4S dicluster domain-containing protein [Thermoplasmatota archaeon]
MISEQIDTMAKNLKITIDRELCTGCGICIRFCPKDVLGESDELNQYGNHYAEVKDLDSCIECRRCELYCPDFAISVETEEEKE